jgi:long-chain acyl-CoA synthetase
VAINTRLKPPEIIHLLTDSGASALLVSTGLEDVAVVSRAQAPDVRHVIGIGAGHGFALDYETLLATAAPDEPGVEVSEDDLFVLAYTSGTTGRPKGAMLTQRSSATAALQGIANFHLQKRHRYLLHPAFFFASGGASRFHAVMRGCRIVITNFEPGEVLRLIESERITHMTASPSATLMLLEHPEIDKRDLSSLELIGLTSAAMPVPLLKRALDRLHCQFKMGYGMTEMGPAGTSIEPDEIRPYGSDKDIRRLASVGRPGVGIRLRVVDDQGRDVAQGQSGEIVLRGETMMQGYWNDPQATAEALRDGWFWTGDIGTLDEDGFLYIVDRRKDMIVSGGINVYPREVEEVLYGHPAVLEVAVVGVPHERWGETVKAIVSLRPGRSASADELIAYCKERLASYKKPTSVDFVDSLPKTGSGKVWKKPLRDQYWVGRESRVI